MRHVRTRQHAATRVRKPKLSSSWRAVRRTAGCSTGLSRSVSAPRRWRSAKAAPRKARLSLSDAAAREDDFRGRAAHNGRHAGARGFDGCVGSLTVGVNGGRIAERLAEVGEHDGQDTRIDRRGGGVIEVDLRCGHAAILTCVRDSVVRPTPAGARMRAVGSNRDIHHRRARGRRRIIVQQFTRGAPACPQRLSRSTGARSWIRAAIRRWRWKSSWWMAAGGGRRCLRRLDRRARSAGAARRRQEPLSRQGRPARRRERQHADRRALVGWDAVDQHGIGCCSLWSWTARRTSRTWARTPSWAPAWRWPRPRPDRSACRSIATSAASMPTCCRCR